MVHGFFREFAVRKSADTVSLFELEKGQKVCVRRVVKCFFLLNIGCPGVTPAFVAEASAISKIGGRLESSSSGLSAVQRRSKG